MKPLSECKWEVRVVEMKSAGLLVDSGEYGVIAITNDNAGIMPPSNLFSYMRFDSPTEAKAPWEKFARVNNWPKWRYV